MVRLTIPCKFLRKDKLHEHERSQCHTNAVQAEAIATAAMHSPAIGILCDESTNIANVKQLVVFVRFLVKGQTKTSF
jgi:hypothetical protein